MTDPMLASTQVPTQTLQRTTAISNHLHYTDRKAETRDLPACPLKTTNQYSLD